MQNKKINLFLMIIFVLNFLLLQVGLVSAAEEIVISHSLSGPSDLNVYEGQTVSGQFKGIVYLDVWSCNYQCSWETSQGETGSLPTFTSSSETRYYYPSVRATGSYGSGSISSTVSCYRVPSTFCTSKEGSNSNSVSFTFDYCGDGQVQNQYEKCDGSNLGGKTCQNQGYGGGTLSCSNDCSNLITSNCYRCGDGKVNPGEQCDNGANNGQPCTALWSQQASSCSYCTNSCTLGTIPGPYCGDGLKNGPENCNSCPPDAGCSSNEQCDSGQCINIANDNNNCGSKGNKCDITKKPGPGGKVYCSGDNRNLIQEGQVIWEECIEKTCQQKNEIRSDKEDCGNNLCQDGHCGCSEGYFACQETGKCEKQGALKLNEACGCDFQCESGYCNQGRCLEGLIVKLSSTDNAIRPGEETSVTLSVNNPFNHKVDADIVINLASAQLSGVLSGQDCSGNQCKTTINLPENGREEVSIMIQGTKEGSVGLESTITYSINGEHRINIQKSEIKVTSCGNENCDLTSITGAGVFNKLQETKFNIGKYSVSALTFLAGILALIVLGVVTRMIFHRKPSHKLPKEKNAKKKKSKEKVRKLTSKKGEYDILNVCSKCEEVLSDVARFCHLCGGKGKKLEIKK